MLSEPCSTSSSTCQAVHTLMKLLCLMVAWKFFTCTKVALRRQEQQESVGFFRGGHACCVCSIALRCLNELQFGER